MIPNKEYILELVKKKQWNWAALARHLGVSKTEVSRWVKGERTGGRKLFEGIIKAFHDEPMDKLFIFPLVKPKGDNKG